MCWPFGDPIGGATKPMSSSSLMTGAQPSEKMGWNEFGKRDALSNCPSMVSVQFGPSENHKSDSLLLQQFDNNSKASLFK